MNKPTLITGIALFMVGLLLVIIGFAIGGSSLDDQVYEEVANEGDFTSPRPGTFMYDYSSDSSLGTKIEIASRAERVLVFDLTVEDNMGSSVLTQKTRMTPYSKELDLASFSIYTITIDFDGNESLLDFSIIIWEKTLSDSALGSCCMGLLLPGIGGLLMLVGLILIIVGLVVGRKKQIVDDPWNKPQELSDPSAQIASQQAPPPQSPPRPVPPTPQQAPPPLVPPPPPRQAEVTPYPERGSDPPYPESQGPQYGQTIVAGTGNSPNVLRPPPGQ